MGSGSWSATDYHDRATARRRTGTDAFAYSADAIRSGRLRPHQTLDPQGLQFRESRDNEEHPNSNAILISLDVTGSMGAVCRAIHADLPKLHELLLGHKYIADPQICFAAVGDATCDEVPLQVGQFESDNRMDQNLENMILEGGGGGQKTESYELAMYIAARHTAIDCFEKRGRKGYLFMIGDEMAYPAVKRKEVRRLLGEHVAMQADIPLPEMIAEVSRKYHLFYVIPGGASHGTDQGIRTFWERHLGPERVIALASPEDTSQCIAMTIGVNEGVVTVEQAKQQLTHRGVVGKTIEQLATSLAGLPKNGPTVAPPGGRHL